MTMPRKRKSHSGAFKAQVALAALKGDRTLAELSEQFGIHPNQISDWKQVLMESAALIFEGGSGKKRGVEPDLKELHAKIGELTLENDFLENALTRAGWV